MLLLHAIVVCLACRSQAPTSLDVFAAASLHESFQAIAQVFEQKHPGVSVRLNFGGSQQLAAQINQGASCDVLASADEHNLDKVAYDPNSRRVFALNRLEVVVSASDRGIRSLRDLSRARRIILAAPAVPVGAYARESLQAASKVYGSSWLSAVESNVVSQEQDVREVLAKVELGEADAGIVYVSDAVSAKGKIRPVEIAEAFQPRIFYPIAILKSAKNPHLAREFVKSVLDPPGQSELVARGFVSPLGPRRSMILLVGNKRFLIPTQLPSSGWRTVTALGPDKKPHKYRGVPLAHFLPLAVSDTSIELVGADEYRVSLPLADVLKAGAVLVPKAGNLQLIVPGLPPHDWVDWLTRISIR
jgi:molybdate transport system substrate-binding protein